MNTPGYWGICINHGFLGNVTRFDRRATTISTSSNMKLTCLSIGNDYYFPASHILELSGFHILLECPVDLSVLTVFSPLNSTKTSLANSLIKTIPWYKTLKNLHLWDPSLIDVVLISTPASMLGLPFLVQSGKFSGKVYATEATVKIGKMMMEEIVELHDEFVRFYGMGKKHVSWMNWEEIEMMEEDLKKVLMGEDGDELGSWTPLYSAADIKDCIQLVQPLKYAEETCFNGIIRLKAFSSGLEIGSCNWTISAPKKSMSYLSSSIFQSAHAMSFDYQSLCGNDFVIFSDLSCFNSNTKNITNNHPEIGKISDNEDEMRSYLSNSTENSEENDKINFICSCVVNSLIQGGSVLIPIGRLGLVLILLEQISQLLEASNLKVPIFMISSTAEEMLAFTNAAPEWLCKQRQENLFSGEALFGHVELIKEKKLNVFSVLHSSELLATWEEPCIVFSPHWSLRLGSVVHLLHRWHEDKRCLLILEEGVDAEAALLPFKPVAMKVLQCSFLSGLRVDKILPLLKILQPKIVLFPEVLKPICLENNVTFPLLFYSENKTLCIPNVREHLEASLSTDLAFQLRPKKFTVKSNDTAIARLVGGRLLLSNGEYVLASSKEKSVSKSIKKYAQIYWGSFDPVKLLSGLNKKGIDGFLVLPKADTSVSEDEVVCSIKLNLEDHDALINLCATHTVICCADEIVTARICEALNSVYDGI